MARPTSRRLTWCLGRTIFRRPHCPPISTRSGKNYLLAAGRTRLRSPGPALRSGQCESGGGLCAAVCDRASERARVMGVVTTPNAPLVSESTLGAVDSNGHAGASASDLLHRQAIRTWPIPATRASWAMTPFDHGRQKAPHFRRPAQIGYRTGRFQECAIQSRTCATERIDFGRTAAESFRGRAGGRGSSTGRKSVCRRFRKQSRARVSPQSETGAIPIATRLLGQSDFQYNSLNRIDGREVGFSSNTGSCSVNGALPFVLGGSAVIDGSSNPPHLYIADPLNNRVLGYQDYRKVNAGVKADLVIGQPDLLTASGELPEQ